MVVVVLALYKGAEYNNDLMFAARLAVEGCRRALQPYTRLGSAEETDTDSEECPGISMVQAAC